MPARRLSEPCARIRFSRRTDAIAEDSDEEGGEERGADGRLPVGRRVRFSLDGAEDVRKLKAFRNRCDQSDLDTLCGEAYEDEPSDCNSDVDVNRSSGEQTPAHDAAACNAKLARNRCNRIVQCGKDPLFSLSFFVYNDSSESEEQPAEQMRLGFLGAPVRYGPFYEDGGSSDASACETERKGEPNSSTNPSDCYWSADDYIQKHRQPSQQPTASNSTAMEIQTTSDSASTATSTDVGTVGKSTADLELARPRRRRSSLPNGQRSKGTQTHPAVPVDSKRPPSAPKPIRFKLRQTSLTSGCATEDHVTPIASLNNTATITSSTAAAACFNFQPIQNLDETMAGNGPDDSHDDDVDDDMECLSNIFATTTIDHLCDDLLLQIFSQLSIIDQLKLECVCHRWQQLCVRLRRSRLAIKIVGDPRDNVRARKCGQRLHHIREQEVLEFGRLDWLLDSLLPRFKHVHTLNVSLFGLDKGQRRRLLLHVQSDFEQLIHLQLQTPTDTGLYRNLLHRPFACADRLRHLLLHGCCDFERFALLAGGEDELRNSNQAPEAPYTHFRLLQMLPALTTLQLHCSILRLPGQFDVLRQRPAIQLCTQLDTLWLKQARLADQPLQTLCVLCPSIRKLSVLSAGPLEMRLLAEKWASTLSELNVQQVPPEQLLPLLQSLLVFPNLKRLRLNCNQLPVSDRTAFECVCRQLLANERLRCFRFNGQKLNGTQLDRSRPALQSILVMQELNALFHLKYLDMRRLEYKLHLLSGRHLSLLMARVVALNFCADVLLFEDHFPETMADRSQADLEHPIDWPTGYAASSRQRCQRHEFQSLSLQLRQEHWRMRMQERLICRRMRRVRREYIEQLSDSDTSDARNESKNGRPSRDDQLAPVSRSRSRKWSLPDAAMLSRLSAWASQSSLSSLSGLDSPQTASDSDLSDLSPLSTASSQEDEEEEEEVEEAEEMEEETTSGRDSPSSIHAQDQLSPVLAPEDDFSDLDMGVEGGVKSSNDQANASLNRSADQLPRPPSRHQNRRRNVRRLSQEQRQLRSQCKAPFLHERNQRLMPGEIDCDHHRHHHFNNPHHQLPPHVHLMDAESNGNGVSACSPSSCSTPLPPERRILPTDRTRLRSLNFSYSQANSEEILFELIRCSPDLRFMHLHDCHMPSQLIPLLSSHCRKLGRLQLNPLGYVYSCKYGLPHLAGLPCLAELSLSNMRIHDRKLAQVVSECPNLSRVYLTACKGVSGHTLVSFVSKATSSPDVRFELHVDSLVDNEYRHFAMSSNFCIYIDQYSFFKLNFEPFGRLFIFAPLPDRSTLSVHQWPDDQITLGQFRGLQPAKAQLRYFVKRREQQCSRWLELVDDQQPIPVLHNKIVINFSERDVLIK